ncbi:RIP metalloprotease [Candidatus Saccharibacteria bacterium]|nr:RIP metalloprotease [Candidatus Saccharibacteria bacterium]
MQLLLSILGIVLFVGLVLIHEYGHFRSARRHGVVVEEFGLGFPPRAWARRLKSGMKLSLNWLPLGGFVKLKGEHDADRQPGSFGAASLSAKTRILLAGVTANLLAGLILLTLLALIGMPKLITNEWSGEEQFSIASDTKIVRQEVRVAAVQAGSPAAQAGLDSRDVIVSLNERPVGDTRQLQTVAGQLAGQTIRLVYKHRDQSLNKLVTLRSAAEVKSSLRTDQPKGYLGIEPVDLEVRRHTWSAPIVALGFTKQLAWLTLKGIGHALAGLGSTIAGLVTGNQQAREAGQAEATAQVGGPVAIANILWGSGELGIYFVLMIIAIISLTLALINALPVPALDGGRLAVILGARALKRRLNPSTEDLIHGAGMAVLLALVALITIVDVKRF